MIVNRGPQSVQVMKGWPWRRLAGSRSSARQASQVAMSGGTSVRGPSPTPLSRIWNSRCRFPGDRAGRSRCVDLLDDCQRGRRLGEARCEGRHGLGGALHFDDDAGRRVFHQAREPEPRGPPPDERPKADALNDSSDGEPPADHGIHC